MFEAFRTKIIKPAYAALPPEVKKSLTDRATIRGAVDSGAVDAGQPNKSGVRPMEEQLTGPDATPASSGGSSRGAAAPPATVTPELRSAIAGLSAHASERHAAAVARGEKPGADTAIISVLRPPAPGAKRQSLHASGSAADLSMYAGKHLDIFHPDEALEGVLAMIADLPEGNYAMGLPREPRSTDFDLHPDFFEHPEDQSPAEPQLNKKGDRVAGRNKLEFFSWVKVNNPPGTTIDDDIAGLRNPETRKRMQDAVAAAKARGVFIVHLFPDGVDHVHLSTGGPGFGKAGL
ncbi:MAG TPA: hypothetical protein VHW23_32845 [Kofleriaceae bacterium]|nr:hypothetical protein [Kofleriaceae bacterium]